MLQYVSFIFQVQKYKKNLIIYNYNTSLFLDKQTTKLTLMLVIRRIEYE